MSLLEKALAAGYRPLDGPWKPGKYVGMESLGILRGKFKEYPCGFVLLAQPMGDRARYAVKIVDEFIVRMIRDGQTPTESGGSGQDQ